MRRYENEHLLFAPGVLKATRKLFKARPWHGDEARLREIYSRWVDRASEAHGIYSPNLMFRLEPEAPRGAGYYDRYTKTLFLYRPSIITLFHEFRHHVQCERGRDVRGRTWMEDDARAFSLSLYKRVRPERFTEAVQAGTVLFTQPETESA
jgi:hypothetical protein